MWRVLVQTFPNQEVRHTLTKVRDPSREVPPPVPDSRNGNPSIDIPKNGRPPLLDVSGKLDKSIPERVRAASKFGTDARRAILRSGAAMETEMLAPQEAVFFTGTLPGSTPEAMKAIADHADYIVHALKNWLSFYQQNRKDIYVWELQKRGALHLHFVSHIPNKSVREKVIERFHSEWCNLLETVGRRAGVDMFQRGFGDRGSNPREVVQAYAVEVRKSVAAYLSKYVSKTHNVLTKMNERYAPKRWWGRSRPLKALTDKLSSTTEMMFDKMQQGLTYIRNLHDDLSGLAVQQYNYQHKASVGETHISFIMRTSWEMAKNIVSLKGTGLLTNYGQQTISKSSTVELLNLLTDNFSQYSKSSRVGIEPGFMRSLSACQSIQSQWQNLEFGCVKRWMDNLLVLSSKLTCQKMNQLNRRFYEDRNAHPVQHLWTLRDLILKFPNPTWEDIKICDKYLDGAGWSLHSGTSSSDEGTGVDVPREPEPSSFPRFVQEELPL